MDIVLEAPRRSALRYHNKVKALAGASLIGYWPMWEASGAEATDHSGQANHGAYTGVTLGQTGIGDGRTCPLWDATNDFNNIYSAGLAADFNPSEGTLALWIRASAAAVWADGIHRNLITFQADAGNRAKLYKFSDNVIYFDYRAGNTLKQVSLAVTPTAFVHLAMTWSASGDALKGYYQGIQTGATVTGLGVWVGSLAATTTNIGAEATTPTNVWDGYLAHALLCNAPLSASVIAQLATVG